MISECFSLWWKWRDEEDNEIKLERVSRTRSFDAPVRGHLMPPQKHLYNGLARPVDYSIFARERHGNGLALQPAGRDGQRERLGEDIMRLLQASLRGHNNYVAVCT